MTLLSPRWRKVVRDFGRNKTRTILVVLSIAVGVFAFGSVFITEDVLVNDMDTQYQAINPSTITISIRSNDDSLARWARRQPEVIDAQVRAIYPVKLMKDDQELNLDLYAYSDYHNISINQPELESGEWPIERGTILLERDSAATIGIQLGDRINIETPDGDTHQLQFIGIVHDLNVFPAGMFPQLSGYVSIQTLQRLGLSGTYNNLEIVSRSEFNTVHKLEGVADELRERLQRTGAYTGSVQVREPGKHWARDTTQSFTLILSVIGVFSLILSGFLVINTVSALLTEQKRQIGIMKAIGGTAGQIISVYFVMVILYGLLALLVALPVGMGLAYIFTLAVVNFLNIDILNFSLPLRVFILQAAAALVVPLVASVIPIIGSVRGTVREAISTHGLSERGRFGLFDRMLLSVRALPRPILLSIRATFQRRGRLLLTLGTLTIAGTLFISVINVRSALTAELDIILKTVFNFQAQLAFEGDYGRRQVERIAERLPGIAAAEGRTATPGQRLKSDGSKGATFTIIGLPPDSNFMQPDIIAGRWLNDNDRNSIVLTSRLAEEMTDIQVGDMMTVVMTDKEYKWHVVGIMLWSFDRIGYANFDYVSTIMGEKGLASSLYIRTEQGNSQSQSASAKLVEEGLKKSGIRVAQSITKDVIAAANSSQFDFLVAFLLSMAAMTALVGGLGLAGMISLNVVERTREIGVMRSIGASHATLFTMVIVEGWVVGIMSWLLAIPLSIPFSMVFNSMLGQTLMNQPLEFIFSPQATIIWLLLISLISVIASLLPAYRATKMSVRETLAYE